MFEPGPTLFAQPATTLRTLRSLGVGVVRVTLAWSQVAPDSASRVRPKNFDPGIPSAYPAANWLPYDTIVRDAHAEGIQVDFVLTGDVRLGVPLWAAGAGAPRGGYPQLWEPSAQAYGQFVQAVALRYSGSYAPPSGGAPLPRVSFWELWNEPNFGLELAPQAIDGSRLAVAPTIYRQLVGHGWNALQRTGHGHDTIVIGNLAPRGLSGAPSAQFPQGFPGTYSTTKPLTFVQALYCVNASDRPLSGSRAKAVGCPATQAASRRFMADNPALFEASGFGMHPYPYNDVAPNVVVDHDPDDIDFTGIPRLERTLDRIHRGYGSHARLGIYNTEFGYISSPPAPRGPFRSPKTDALFLNLAEYLSYRDPRVENTMQYLLQDVPLKASGFASGLLFLSGQPKATYFAYRMPIFMPRISSRRGQALDVWGCARPARYAAADTHRPQLVDIQFQARSSPRFATVKTVTLASNRCYFDVRVSFPSSGTVRLAWSYPGNDPMLPALVHGNTAYSRDVQIIVR